MSSLRPRDARTEYLNGQTAEKKAEIIARADEVGPGRDDADWLVAKAADDAAKRIEAVVKNLETTAAAGALPPDLTARLDYLEKLVKQRIPQAEPIPLIARYVTVFVVGFLVAETLGLMLLNGWLPAAIDRFNAFGSGLTVAALVLVYLWLAPIVRKGGRSG